MRVMPDDGDYVDTNDVFYTRLINSGDIIKSDAPKAEPQKRDKPSDK